mgnify:CR=1 FL=1
MRITLELPDNGRGSTIDTIGNIIEEKWFNQREFFAVEREDK